MTVADLIARLRDLPPEAVVMGHTPLGDGVAPVTNVLCSPFGAGADGWEPYATLELLT